MTCQREQRERLLAEIEGMSADCIIQRLAAEDCEMEIYSSPIDGRFELLAQLFDSREARPEWWCGRGSTITQALLEAVREWVARTGAP